MRKYNEDYIYIDTDSNNMRIPPGALAFMPKPYIEILDVMSYLIPLEYEYDKNDKAKKNKSKNKNDMMTLHMYMLLLLQHSLVRESTVMDESSYSADNIQHALDTITQHMDNVLKLVKIQDPDSTVLRQIESLFV